MVAPPYPWPIEAMITRYGLRSLTEAERVVFPGISLACDIFKGRLIRPPTAIPRVRSGWVVWIAETYPGCFLVRLPGGASFTAPYHHVSWERVPDKTPATTVEEIYMEDKRWQAEALKWRLGQMRTTPETRLTWSCLAEWLVAWNKLQNRAHSTLRYQQEAEHLRLLPVEMIEAEADETVLYTFLDAFNQDDALPPRGMRQKHPTTPLVVAANNRLAQLGATPYRHYRQQQSMHRALQQPPRTRPSRSARPDTSDGMTLSLF
ncbi:MAG: hypothetical protein KA314_14860 [Chloroflexi bacterium]|nr:hypothetical protein [Chloroflexota bacterium]MBP8057115.1 hypothetical protein [Chloroflexota bacterium]